MERRIIEGPFISKDPAAKGCHSEEYIRPANIFEYEDWRNITGHDFTLIITLAPEIPGAEQFMAGVRERDRITKEKNGMPDSRAITIFMLGHSSGSAQDVKNTERLASGGTHLLNAYLREIDKKEPGYPFEIISHKNLWVSVIPCPYHLHPNILLTIIRAKGVEKTILITDSAPGAGLQEGSGFSFAGQKYVIKNGAVRVPGTDRLAGSALTMPKAVANAVNLLDCSLPEAIRMITRNPAELLGVDEETGSLEQGKKANIVLFGFEGKEKEKKLVVYKNMLEGELIYENPCF